MAGVFCLFVFEFINLILQAKAAQLQQAFVLLLGLILVVWLTVFGFDARVLAAPMLLAGPHATVLAIEFGLARRLASKQGAPLPPLRLVLRAWACEVMTNARVFGWRQPFRSRRFGNDLQPVNDGRPVVVLVHGFLCNRGVWNPWMQKLTAAGVRFAAVNLEPPFATIDAYVRIVDEAVFRAHASTGIKPLLVAHSMGGLAVRAWLATHPAADPTSGVITIGTPHYGTWLARFGRAPNVRQMRIGSAWLAALSSSESAARRSRFTCYYSRCDNVVFPAEQAQLPGADNREVVGAAHLGLLEADEVFDDMLRKLTEIQAAAANTRSPGSTTPASMDSSARARS